MYGSQNEKPQPKKRTVPELKLRKVQRGARPITMVTAYDYTMARLVDASGMDMVLVGDSLGMVVQGESTTIPVSLEEMVYHCKAVSKGLAQAHLVGDMPFMSYQVSLEKALESAGILMKEGKAESVKLEGGEEVAPIIDRMVRSGIPVVGHLGLTPQSVHALGGFKMQGRGDEAAEKLMHDARCLEQAGAYALVLEAIPPDVASWITKSIAIPTIGIGAGVMCDGQVLVCTDLLGLGMGHSPRFVKRFAELGNEAIVAFEKYIEEVNSGVFPGKEHSFKPNDSTENQEEVDAGRALSLIH